MNDLTIDDVCILLNLAMRIDTGLVPLNRVLNEISRNVEYWVEVLEFFENFNDLTRDVFNKIYLECKYIRS